MDSAWRQGCHSARDIVDKNGWGAVCGRKPVKYMCAYHGRSLLSFELERDMGK